MSQNKEKEIHIGEVYDSKGALNRHVVCDVSHVDGSETYYTLWITNAFCDWMTRSAIDGVALAVGMAVTMRLTWDEICGLKYQDLLLHNPGAWISKVAYTGGIPFLGGRSVSLSRTTLTWVLTRVTYLCMCGYTPEEILKFPVAGQQDDPSKGVTGEVLREKVRNICGDWAEEMSRYYGVTLEDGAII